MAGAIGAGVRLLVLVPCVALDVHTKVPTADVTTARVVVGADGKPSARVTVANEAAARNLSSSSNEQVLAELDEALGARAHGAAASGTRSFSLKRHDDLDRSLQRKHDAALVLQEKSGHVVRTDAQGNVVAIGFVVEMNNGKAYMERSDNLTAAVGPGLFPAAMNAKVVSYKCYPNANQGFDKCQAGEVVPFDTVKTLDAAGGCSIKRTDSSAQPSTIDFMDWAGDWNTFKVEWRYTNGPPQASDRPADCLVMTPEVHLVGEGLDNMGGGTKSKKVGGNAAANAGGNTAAEAGGNAAADAGKETKEKALATALLTAAVFC